MDEPKIWDGMYIVLNPKIWDGVKWIPYTSVGKNYGSSSLMYSSLLRQSRMHWAVALYLCL